MPVKKVPVIYKFGIISPSHRLELQERLAKRTQLLKAKDKRLIKASKNPLDVTEDFVVAYNATHDAKRREKLDDKAEKLLEKLKRQVGLKSGGIGNHVDNPIAWTELTQLSQCKGHIQQECLDVLLVTLDQLPTSGENVPVLFFLAESVLYSLRTDVIYEQFLGSSEVKLLFIGQRVFARLFFHHMCGRMGEFVDLRRRLHTYVDGFLDSQKVYKPYPHILSCLRHMSDVGYIIIGDAVDEDDGEGGGGGRPKQMKSHNPPDAHPLPIASHTSAALSAAPSSDAHELAPTLWHSLDVWRCACSLGGGLSQALGSMQDCAVGLAMENWIDVICALDVLGDAARSNLETLTVLQSLACGSRGEVSLGSQEEDADFEERDSMTDFDRDTVSDSRYATRLPAIAESELSMKSKQGLVQDVNHKEAERDRSISGSLGGASSSKSGHVDQLETVVQKDERDWTNSRSAGGEFASGRRDSERMGETRFDDRSDVRNFEDDFDSNASSLLSNQLAAENAVMGLCGWRWELALKYVDVLSHIVLFGATSLIRRKALMGANETTDYIHQTASIVRSPLESAGLFDLLFFRTVTQESTGKGGGANDWGWRVRFAAFLNLYKIHACLSRDQAMLGIRTVVWNVLERAAQLERDVRVLEASKVAQIDANLEGLLYDHLSGAVPTNLGARIAQGLVSTYLPPLPPPSSASRPQTRHLTHGVVTQKSEAPHEIIGRQQSSRYQLRTSLRDELMLSSLTYRPTVSCETRNSKKLNYMIEDQWRKDLEQQASEEQAAKLKEIDEKGKRMRAAKGTN